MHRSTPEQNLLDTVCDRLISQFQPQKIILFGSWAKGTAQADSDLDLLVIMPEPVDRRQIAIEMRRALSDLPISKDIVVATPSDVEKRGEFVGTVLRPALREGQVLFEQS